MSVNFRVFDQDNSLMLLPGTRVKMLFKSSFWMNSGDAPTRTFSFNVPVEPNQKFFKYANLLEVIGKTYVYQVKVEFCGRLLGDALLLVEEYSQDMYKARVTVDRGNYALSLDKPIREFSYKSPTKYRYNTFAGGVPDITYKDFLWQFVPAFPPGFTDPVKTLVDFFSTELQQQIQILVTYTYGQTIEQHIDALVSAINKDVSIHCILVKKQTAHTIRVWDLAANDQYADLVFGPATIEWFNYFLDPVLSATHPDPVNAEYAHANNVIANPGQFDYIFFPVYVPLYFTNIPGFNFEHVINHYFPASTGAGPAVNGTDGSIPTNWIKHNLLMPYPYLYKTIKLILDELKININDDFWDDELKTLTFFTPMYMNLFKDYVSGGLVTRNFQFAQILPDIKLGALLDGLKVMFGMISHFDSLNQSVRFVSRKSVIMDPNFEDWTNKVTFGYNSKRSTANIWVSIEWPEDELLVAERLIQQDRFNKQPDVDVVGSLTNGRNNDYRLVFKENNHYRKRSDFASSGWEFYKEGLENYNYTGADTEDELKISTLFSFRGKTVYTKDGKIVDWLLPWTNQPIFKFDEQAKEIKPQLLFYRGVIDTVQVQEGGTPDVTVEGSAPLGTYHNYDKAGNKIGEYNLALNHPDGLISTWHRQYYDLRKNSSPVNFEAPLNEIDLGNLNELVKKRIDNQNYILDEVEVEVEIGSSAIGLSKITAWPVKFDYQ